MQTLGIQGLLGFPGMAFVGGVVGICCGVCFFGFFSTFLICSFNHSLRFLLQKSRLSGQSRSFVQSQAYDSWDSCTRCVRGCCFLITGCKCQWPDQNGASSLCFWVSDHLSVGNVCCNMELLETWFQRGQTLKRSLNCLAQDTVSYTCITPRGDSFLKTFQY